MPSESALGTSRDLPSDRSDRHTDATGPLWPERVLQVAAGALAVLVLVQATSAGHLWSGNAGARVIHREMVFAVIVWIALAELLAAALVVRPGRGTGWPLLLAAGFTGRVAIHAPLGVSILVLNLLRAVTAPAVAGRRRTARTTRTRD